MEWEIKAMVLQNEKVKELDINAYDKTKNDTVDAYTYVGIL